MPFLVEALSRPGLSADDRRLLVRNMGRLDRSAVPPLVAALDSPDPALAADAATVLGMIGDKAAVPFLTFAAASAGSPPPLRNAAQAAIARLTGRPFSAQPRTPVQVLDRRGLELSSPPGRVSRRSRRRLDLGQRTQGSGPSARCRAPRPKRSSACDWHARPCGWTPRTVDAQVAQISLALEKAIERVGFTAFPAKDPATFAAATASGPSILGEVLKTAIADGKTDLAAAAATALAR